SPEAEVFLLLRFVAAHGNCSVFRWRTFFEPERLERPEPPREAPEPPFFYTVGLWEGHEGTLWTPKGFGNGTRGGIWVLGRGFWVPWGDTQLGLGVPPPAPEGVARGSDALTLLESAETRNQFIDELMELELFLAQRLLELEDEADVVAMSQLQVAPALLQGQSGHRVRAHLATVRDLLGQLCSRSLQHLCMILASPR
ncbi:CK5P3 protein, partial [Sylvietta virens]|nr:CK5P3 protein [Sylvietta virens]